METITLENKKPSNIKPDNWYDEYFKIMNLFSTGDGDEYLSIKELKKWDKQADDNDFLGRPRAPFDGELFFFTIKEEHNNLDMNKKILKEVIK